MVSYLDWDLGVRANAYLDDTGTLVTEDHVGLLEMLICSAKTGMRDSNENLVGIDALLGGGLDNLALLGALEDCELDLFDHCGGYRLQ